MKTEPRSSRSQYHSFAGSIPNACKTLLRILSQGDLSQSVITSDRLINDKWAVQRAKFTIEKYYSVVGVYENLGQSLIAFEKYIPRFFQGASELYKGILGMDFILGFIVERGWIYRWKI